MTNKPDSVDQVVVDLQARKRLGYERYGIALNVDTDKDMLQEAYEEAMDLCIYLRTAIEQRAKIK